jgi:hypothetical protein
MKTVEGDGDSKCPDYDCGLECGNKYAHYSFAAGARANLATDYFLLCEELFYIYMSEMQWSETRASSPLSIMREHPLARREQGIQPALQSSFLIPIRIMQLRL